MIAAVFDLDRTLLPDTTAERIFLRYLVRQRLLGAQAAVQTAWFLVAAGGRRPFQATRRHRPYLKGLAAPELLEAGTRCFEEFIRPRLSGDGLRRLSFHREAGHRLVLLSGSLPFVVEPLVAWLDAHDAICSRMEIRSNRLTGRLIGLHPYGEAKSLLVQRLARQHSIELAASYCYADHHSDAHVLRLFGYPVCVNPSDRLRQIARTMGWPVEQFR